LLLHAREIQPFSDLEQKMHDELKASHRPTRKEYPEAAGGVFKLNDDEERELRKLQTPAERKARKEELRRAAHYAKHQKKAQYHINEANNPNPATWVTWVILAVLIAGAVWLQWE
jgi:hypothetical protein